MTSDEAFNQKLWHVLQRIQAERQLKIDNEQIGYVLSDAITPNTPSKEEERNIVLKLAQLHAVKIIQHTKTDRHIQNKEKFELAILLPKFDEVYKKFQLAVDPTASNFYFEKIVKVLSPGTKKVILEMIEKLEKKAETTPDDDLIYFEIAAYRSDGYDEQSLINKLEEWKILTVEGNDEYGHPLILTSLEKIRKFKNVLEKQYHEKVLVKQIAEQAIRPSGKNESFSLQDAGDRGLEDFFKEEMALINKLLQICNKETKSIPLIHPAHLASNTSDQAGFDKIETLKDLHLKYKIFQGFNTALDKIDMKHVGLIKARISYDKLLDRAESLHDEVESWKGNVFGMEQQKRNLLERLNGRFKKYPDQEIFTYSERILGTYRPENFSNPLGYSLSKPDKNRPEIRYQFMRAMRALEKDGRFQIVDVQIDFFAEPQPTEDTLNDAKWRIGNSGEPEIFYPAMHCKVTFKRYIHVIKSQGNPIALPKDVGWKVLREVYTLIFKDGKKLEFAYPKKSSAKYFKVLIENHGLEVKHEQIESKLGLTKDKVENLIKTLRKKVKSASIENRVKFETKFNGAYILNIK